MKATAPRPNPLPGRGTDGSASPIPELGMPAVAPPRSPRGVNFDPKTAVPQVEGSNDSARDFRKLDDIEKLLKEGKS